MYSLVVVELVDVTGEVQKSQGRVLVAFQSDVQLGKYLVSAVLESVIRQNKLLKYHIMLQSLKYLSY